MDVKIASGRVLKEARKQKGLSQERLALEAGIERTYVSRLENGTYQPSLAMILCLARVLEIQPGLLVDRVDELMKESN